MLQIVGSVFYKHGTCADAGVSTAEQNIEFNTNTRAHNIMDYDALVVIVPLYVGCLFYVRINSITVILLSNSLNKYKLTLLRLFLKRKNSNLKIAIYYSWQIFIYEIFAICYVL